MYATAVRSCPSLPRVFSRAGATRPSGAPHRRAAGRTRQRGRRQGPQCTVGTSQAEPIYCAATTSVRRQGQPRVQGDHAQVLNAIIEAGDVIAAQLRSGSATTRHSIIAPAVELVSLCSDYILVTVTLARPLGALGDPGDGPTMLDPIHLSCPATRVRKGHQLRLIIPAATAPTPSPSRDEKLVALVAEAHAARQLVAALPDKSIANIAKAEGRCRARPTRLLSLSCLAPDIVTAIVEGRQPPLLNARALAGIELPLAWPEQRAALGFPSGFDCSHDF